MKENQDNRDHKNETRATGSKNTKSYYGLSLNEHLAGHSFSKPIENDGNEFQSYSLGPEFEDVPISLPKPVTNTTPPSAKHVSFANVLTHPIEVNQSAPSGRQNFNYRSSMKHKPTSSRVLQDNDFNSDDIKYSPVNNWEGTILVSFVLIYMLTYNGIKCPSFSNEDLPALKRKLLFQLVSTYYNTAKQSQRIRDFIAKNVAPFWRM